MIKREASAIWRGKGMDGKGEISTQSGTLKGTQYSFGTRFENGVGTNPEELVGAAHAGCFAMATSFALSKAGFAPEELRVGAQVVMEKQGEGFAVTAVHLTLVGKVPGIDDAKFQELAAGAKANCPISKLLNAKISLDAKLS